MLVLGSSASRYGAPLSSIAFACAASLGGLIASLVTGSAVQFYKDDAWWEGVFVEDDLTPLPTPPSDPIVTPWGGAKPPTKLSEMEMDDGT